jgi:hypothetical protein
VKCFAQIVCVGKVQGQSEAKIGITRRLYLKHSTKQAEKPQSSPKSSFWYAFQDVKCFTKLISIRVGTQAV